MSIVRSMSKLIEVHQETLGNTHLTDLILVSTLQLFDTTGA